MLVDHFERLSQERPAQSQCSPRGFYQVESRYEKTLEITEMSNICLVDGRLAVLVLDEEERKFKLRPLKYSSEEILFESFSKTDDYVICYTPEGNVFWANITPECISQNRGNIVIVPLEFGNVHGKVSNICISKDCWYFLDKDNQAFSVSRPQNFPYHAESYNPVKLVDGGDIHQLIVDPLTQHLLALKRDRSLHIYMKQVGRFFQMIPDTGCEQIFVNHCGTFGLFLDQSLRKYSRQWKLEKIIETGIKKVHLTQNFLFVERFCDSAFAIGQMDEWFVADTRDYPITSSMFSGYFVVSICMNGAILGNGEGKLKFFGFDNKGIQRGFVDVER